ncbi:MAG: 50S ribosomal protein L37ae [Thermoplasmata archaeon]|nr:50S ribosomal protein L37ae [Thermoplasmata archaeon]NIS12929.1 50S ribosomal protein L37ae [Thermoplasmata archaeon]NIS20837.1 50S ribosomal protein L37ae [Thermoplasmata archaeon]NIT78251.1 50S ribosomal protein L37ae [Thermoplasmata archaeon]NIU49896.1 50S ribosomal protein L37ae [Thermoplasmata archaeon]
MTRRTKKVGVAGRYGPRYGVRIRKQMTAVTNAKNRSYECPRCNHVAVKRVSTGIWKCRRCDLKFAGGAYTPKVSTRISMPTKGDTEVVVINAEEDEREEEA